jgi:hypothetical protein
MRGTGVVKINSCHLEHFISMCREVEHSK